MSLDIYSTAAQLKAIELLPKHNSLLWDIFVKDEGVSEEDKMVYDFRKGVQRMAPVVHNNTGGVLMGRGGFETRELDFCTIAPERIIEPQHLKGRSFGEKIMGGMTPDQREKKLLMQDLSEMNVAIQLRREWMARQLILTGTQEVFTYTNEGRSKEATMLADFGFTQHFVPETKWDQPGAQIESDMKKIVDLVVNDGLGQVDVILMAADVAEAMYANSDYLNQHNILRVDTGRLESSYRGAGVRYLGRNADGIDMYSFSGRFINDLGLPESYIPSGTLIAGSHGMIKSMHGPVIQIETTGPNAQHQVYAKKVVPLRYASIESNSLKNRLTSRPALMPYNVDGWCVAKVL